MYLYTTLIFTFLLASFRFVAADIVFTSPLAGQTITANTPFRVGWHDDAGTGNTALRSYRVRLYTGSNARPYLLAVLAEVPSSGESATATIDPMLAGEHVHGFFLGLETGPRGEIFSSRFSITGMRGTFSAEMREALAGVTDTRGPGPGPGRKALTARHVEADAPLVGRDTANAAAGAFGTPWTDQTGPTRYAPMQAIPPTKITATNTQPLFAPSSVDILTEALGTGTVSVTLTQPQTYKVPSRQNTAAAASHPNQGMQRYLERWKD